jgi:penicillin-binding protein 1A
VPIAGKTGTTNDARDAWFVGYSSNIVAGCYVGYDQPQSMPGGSGGGYCGPVFQAFMTAAIARFGGAEFAVPSGGFFRKIDRFSGIPLPEDAEGDAVISEYFRDGVEVVFGSAALVDGGFAFGANLPLFAAGEVDGGGVASTTSGPVTTDQPVVAVPAIPQPVPGQPDSGPPPAPQPPGVSGNADFGTLSSGGLY